MSDSPNLVLPYLADTQAQKHVTHNDALRILDALVLLSVKTFQNNTPPASPMEGDRHLVGAAPTGAWAGQANKIAAFQDAAWRFFALKTGWRVWSEPDAKLRAYNGIGWVEVYGTAIQDLALLGIGTTADATNPLSVRGPNALFTAKYAGAGGSGDLSLKVNKETAADTASLLFQNSFSGRAEIGLIGDDEWSVKTSTDGSTFVQALKASTARVVIPLSTAATTTTTGALQVAGGLGAGGAVHAGEDCFINAIRIGRGAGNISSNFCFGTSALASNTTGAQNTAIGTLALNANTTGQLNIAVGPLALLSNVDGKNNVAIGSSALGANISGERNTSVGTNALYTNTSGDFNVAIGEDALFSSLTGDSNTGVGHSALSAASTYSNCSGLGAGSAVTGGNQVQLGNSSTTTYVYGTVQNRSDLRDKADIRDTVFGLNFLERLRPVDFRWDMREDYRAPLPQRPEGQLSEAQKAAHRDAVLQWAENNRLGNIVRDGSRKRNRFHCGFVAQEVKAALDAAGQDCGVLQDHSLRGGDAAMSLGYDQFVPMLIKAVQELAARVRALEAA